MPYNRATSHAVRVWEYNVDPPVGWFVVNHSYTSSAAYDTDPATAETFYEFGGTQPPNEDFTRYYRVNFFCSEALHKCKYVVVRCCAVDLANTKVQLTVRVKSGDVYSAQGATLATGVIPDPGGPVDVRMDLPDTSRTPSQLAVCLNYTVAGRNTGALIYDVIFNFPFGAQSVVID